MLVSLLLLVKMKKGDNYFFQNANSIRTYVLHKALVRGGEGFREGLGEEGMCDPRALYDSICGASPNSFSRSLFQKRGRRASLGMNLHQYFTILHILSITYVYYLYIIYVIIHLVARYLFIHIFISTIILFYYGELVQKSHHVDYL